MTTLLRDGVRLPRRAFALALGASLLSGPMVMALGDDPAIPPQPKPVPPVKRPLRRGETLGTLGYGPPGLHPGFQGFGLGYHPGYGYGGDALGPGAEGGYPFYGGPGYPHAWPVLRRFKPITPFPYYGGPGHPTANCPNFYGEVGPLVPDQPVITVLDDGNSSVPAADYGAATGVLPYPESAFAPFTSIAGEGGSSSGVITPPGVSMPSNPGPDAPPAAPSPPIPPTSAPPITPAPAPVIEPPAQAAKLGIEEEPVVDSNGVRGLKVSRVFPETAAEKAGLRAGDVIYSIDGYTTTKGSDLAWIISHASPGKAIRMSVRTPSDGEPRSFTAQLR